MLDIVAPYLPTVVSFAEIVLGVGSSLGVLSAAGAVPKVGLVRALTLGLKSAIKTSSPTSVRVAEMAALRSDIQVLKKGRYVVIAGSKGIGKSCLVDSALSRYVGVIRISTESGVSKHVIIDQVLKEITGIRFKIYDLSANTRRVLFFYRLIFKLPPIVVIRVPERSIGHQYADVTSAVRALADDYGLRVIVDGSPNSLSPELLYTNRERVLSIEPMPRNMIEGIPEIQTLIQFLRKQKIDSAVFKILGGNPAKYDELDERYGLWMLEGINENDIVIRVKAFLLKELSNALTVHINKSTVNTKEIIKKFHMKKGLYRISSNALASQNLVIDYPNKVFREVYLSETYFVLPATSAVSLIITRQIVDHIGVRQLIDELFRV